MTRATHADSQTFSRPARAACLAALAVLLAAGAARAQTTPLDGGWQLLVDREGTLTAETAGRRQGWRDTRVGLSWNAQFADLRDYMGVAWYRLRFDAPALAGGRRALLRFGAVDYFAEVHVNGRKAGEHEGGYTPFVFDVTESLKPGANELLVRVVDPPMDEAEGRARFPSMLYKEIPHGKQNWYVQTGGIWQPVWLEVRPRLHVKSVRVESSNDGDVRVRVETSEALGPAGPTGPSGGAAFARGGAGRGGRALSVRVVGPDGTSVGLRATGGDRESVTYAGRVAAPKLWSPDAPNLYTVEASLGEDRFSDRFGFRTFEARDGKFYLNGEPFYMIGALDQDFYPETIYTAPSKEYVRAQIRKAKRLGLNLLRCHIKVCEPAYLEAADEVGMLVWYEVPSWNDFNHFSPRAAERGERVFEEMTLRDWNHPSVVIQGIINESWGADLKQAEQRRWLRAAFDRAKQLVAPTGRLVVDNSACCQNFHVKTEIDDFHQYFSQPDEHERWDKWVADFASRPAWTFSPHGDAERTGREPLVVSEFGNWGLPKLPAQLPWWFERDFGGRAVTRPAGLFERFKEFGFDRLFGTYDALAEATQWHQFASLKHEIEEMRRHQSIQGYVITEFTDINWEANGLLDMWRREKVYAAELAKIQRPDLLTARAERFNYESGEPVRFDVLLSRYGATDLAGAELVWRTETPVARGRQNSPAAPARASVVTLARHSFDAPEVERPRRERILLELRDRAGRLVAENTAEIFVFPKARRGGEDTIPLAVAFRDPKSARPELGRALAAAGYNAASGGRLDPKVLVVATSIDAEVESHLRAGGRVVVLAGDKDALPAAWPLKIVARAGSDLDGNWVTNFNWVRSDAAPFDAVAVTKILGFESARAVPRHVIEGVGGADYADVSAGIFYGWLNSNRALAVRVRAGAGRLFVTTFGFDHYGRDPFATRLLDAIIRHAGGPRFEPRLKVTVAVSDQQSAVSRQTRAAR